MPGRAHLPSQRCDRHTISVTADFSRTSRAKTPDHFGISTIRQVIMGTPSCEAAPIFSQTSGRLGLGSGNQKNSGVRCLVVGTIRHEARSSRIDAHPRRILGDDIGLCVRRCTGRGTRWTLVGGGFFRALLKSIDWTLDWALFCSALWTSRPSGQCGGPNSNNRIRPAGVGPPAAGSDRFQAPHRFLPPARSSRLWRMPRRMVRA